jgi:hypothetical protein
MKNANFFNLFFRFLAGAAYVVVGIYAGFIVQVDLGEMAGFQTHHLMGTLFVVYGLFRLYRAYLYYKETKEDDYGSYGDE